MRKPGVRIFRLTSGLCRLTHILKLITSSDISPRRSPRTFSQPQCENFFWRLDTTCHDLSCGLQPPHSTRGLQRHRWHSSLLLSNGVARGKEVGNARHGVYRIDRCNWTGNSTCRTTFVQQHIVGKFHHNYIFNKRIAKGHKTHNVCVWQLFYLENLWIHPDVKNIITVYVLEEDDAYDVDIFATFGNTYLFV